MAYELQIEQEALRQGVPPELALAVVRRESNFDPLAVGEDGEIGLFQIMPPTASELMLAGEMGDPNDPLQNIRGGIAYLRWQYERFGNWGDALTAYNAGGSAVVSGDIPLSTQGYVADILGALGWDDPGLTYTVDVTARADDSAWYPLQASFPGGEQGMMLVALVVLGVGVLVLARS